MENTPTPKPETPAPVLLDPGVVPPPNIKHLCHAKGCNVVVPPKLLMCYPHWKMVPRDIQLRIWKHYRPGQEIDKRPTPKYLEVMQEAIEAVSAKEMRRHNDPSSATRRTGRNDCNRDAHAGFAAAHG